MRCQPRLAGGDVLFSSPFGRRAPADESRKAYEDGQRRPYGRQGKCQEVRGSSRHFPCALSRKPLSLSHKPRAAIDEGFHLLNTLTAMAAGRLSWHAHFPLLAMAVVSLDKAPVSTNRLMQADSNSQCAGFPGPLLRLKSRRQSQRPCNTGRPEHVKHGPRLVILSAVLWCGAERKRLFTRRPPRTTSGFRTH